MKKILSVDKNDVVSFEGKDGRGTFGTKEDCLAYNYNFFNGKCYVCNSKKPIRNLNTDYGRANTIYGANNFAIGRFNKLFGSNGGAIGFNNTIYATATYGIAIGKGAYAENYGEIAFSSSTLPNRAKFSFYQFDGFTTNNTPTEIYLGGVEGQRFFINEDYETAFAIDYSAVALNANSNDIFTNYGHATYKYTNSTLLEVGHDKSTTIRDASTNQYDINFAPISGTPDYIELKVTGDTGHDVYWTVDLKVTEVRNG